jgi:hypothetical protein
MDLRLQLLVLTSTLGVGALGRCAHVGIPGTQIPRTEQNRIIVETVEQYRLRLLERNIEGLLVLASDKYFEDSGTPRSDDDYGYDGLRGVLTAQLKRVKSMRYEIEYRSIKVRQHRAEVEVFLDGSFELAADAGDRYRRVNDYHRFILEQVDENKWKFLSVCAGPEGVTLGARGSSPSESPDPRWAACRRAATARSKARPGARASSTACERLSWGVRSP